MRDFSNWRSVRVWETQLERELRRRHALWLHGFCIGMLTLLLMWGVAHLQMLLGFQSLALRYLVTLAPADEGPLPRIYAEKADERR